MSSRSKRLNSVNSTASAKAGLFDWKPMNGSLKLFTANTNYPSGGSSSRNVSARSQQQQLKPLLNRANSVGSKDLNNENENNSNGAETPIDTKFDDDSFFKLLDLKPASRGNFTRFDDLLDQSEIKTDRSTGFEYSTAAEKKSLNEILNQKRPQNLTELDLGAYGLQEIKGLEKFTGLRILDLSCNRIKKIENVEHLRGLIELKLYGNEIETIENIEMLSQLLSLQLQSNKIRKLEKSLSFAKSLQVLRLDRNKLTAVQQTEIASCSNLIHLNISHNSISSIMFINSLSNLEELIADHMCLTSLDFDTSRCRRLTEIDVSCNKLTDESFEYLTNLKFLTVLNVSKNSITSLAQISRIKSLRTLNAAKNLVKKLEELRSLVDLEVLDVSSNQIDEWFQIETLVNCKELNEVDLRENPVMQRKSIDDIKFAIPNLRVINLTPTDVFAQTAISETSRIAKENNDALQNDLNKFEQQMNTLNESFLKKFREVADTLNVIHKRFENENEYPDLQPIRSNSIAAAMRPQSARLTDALKYSKRFEP